MSTNVENNETTAANTRSEMENTPGNYDVIVIGGGPIGMSSAYHLSKRKAKTLLLEQFTFFNQLGSSAGVSRQFRIPYPEEYMVKLVKQSIPFWDELQSLTPIQLRDKVGTLWFGDPKVHSTEGNIGQAEKALTAEHVPYTTLDAAQIERDYQFKNLPKTYTGLFQADGASTASKAFRGNRIFRSGASFVSPNWTVGGDTDADSNLLVGPQASLLLGAPGIVVRVQK